MLNQPLHRVRVCSASKMDELTTLPDNSPAKVEFRQKILVLQNMLIDMAEKGQFEAIDFPLKHHFSPIDRKYGCCSYAREIFLPKGTVVIGKIHKHQHLNFIMKGKVSVATEHGKKYFADAASGGPYIFLSEVGLKRAVYAEEDTIWVTQHMTEHHGEENLEKIEDEVIAKTYEELGLISSLNQLETSK